MSYDHLDEVDRPDFQRASGDPETDPLENDEILLEVVRGLVTTPARVSIKAMKTSDNETNYLIYVDPKDIGLVIGKGGVTVTALKTVFQAIGRLDKMRVNMRVESAGPTEIYRTRPASSKYNSAA